MTIDNSRGGGAAPLWPRLLGVAGLLPQLLCLIAVLSGDPAATFTAQATAFAYAALILSFLGGMWWGLAARMDSAPDWLWLLAVLPTLLALALCWPWATGGEWPGPSLVALGLLIGGSLVIDRKLVRLGGAPSWWMSLRWPLSLGLGALTIAIGSLA